MKKEPEEYRRETEDYENFHWEILTHKKDRFWLGYSNVEYHKR